MRMWNPDKKGDMDTITNCDRAKRGAEIIGFYLMKYGEFDHDNDQTTLTDIIADLMHFAASTQQAETDYLDQVHFHEALEDAESHFNEEG